MNDKSTIISLFETVCEMSEECLEGRRLSSCSNDKSTIIIFREFSDALEKFKEVFPKILEEKDVLEKQVDRHLADKELLAAKVAHAVNRAYCQAIGSDPGPTWAEASQELQLSALSGVREAQKPNSLSEMHVAWMEYKLAHGWKYGKRKDEAEKTHPCLVPYEELPFAERIKDDLFLAVVRTILSEA